MWEHGEYVPLLKWFHSSTFEEGNVELVMVVVILILLLRAGAGGLGVELLQLGAVGHVFVLLLLDPLAGLAVVRARLRPVLGPHGRPHHPELVVGRGEQADGGRRQPSNPEQQEREVHVVDLERAIMEHAWSKLNCLLSA